MDVWARKNTLNYKLINLVYALMQCIASIRQTRRDNIFFERE